MVTSGNRILNVFVLFFPVFQNVCSRYIFLELEKCFVLFFVCFLLMKKNNLYYNRSMSSLSIQRRVYGCMVTYLPHALYWVSGSWNAHLRGICMYTKSFVVKSHQARVTSDTLYSPSRVSQNTLLKYTKIRLFT